MIKKIAILTSGGDAPGMNAAIKAVVYAAIENGIEPYLVYEGYKGLTEGDFKKVSKKDVKFIGTQGGTTIYSARYPEFKEESVRQQAVDKLNAEGIDALVAIGGDGSYMGAARLTEMGIKTIGLPGTIDNDIPSTDLTIGFNTALDTIVKSLDKIRDTSESHNRAAIVEVMGRHCGDLAIHAAIASGAEVVSTSERKLTVEEIVSETHKFRKAGNRSILIVVTENLYDVRELEKAIDSSGIESRATVLGHPERGGSPVAQDRVLASTMGAFAVEKLIQGENGVAVNIVNGQLQTKDILEVVKMERPSREELFKKYDLIR